jgi:uncharacterized protein
MIIHQPDQNRFVCQGLEDKALIEYRLEGNVCTVTHTFVDSSLRGQGMAGQLAGALYDWAKEQSYTIASECEYMTAWMKRKKL